MGVTIANRIQKLGSGAGKWGGGHPSLAAVVPLSAPALGLPKHQAQLPGPQRVLQEQAPAIILPNEDGPSLCRAQGVPQGVHILILAVRLYRRGAPCTTWPPQCNAQDPCVLIFSQTSCLPIVCVCVCVLCGEREGGGKEGGGVIKTGDRECQHNCMWVSEATEWDFGMY